ncbi:MAG: heavy-metal-associated domain-containing protein [Thiothrix sp.]|nr:heavy-metal-associated domain-containing protein [Thiothrix sp.]HPQ97428.1 heavy metal-associated domain-containing protein [Thiolinea sp.]
MKFKVEKMVCSGCVSTVKGKLEAMTGVTRADVDLATKTAVVEGAVDEQAVIRVLTEAGYPTERVTS